MSKPYINKNDDLIIPFNSDEIFHWWKEGQNLRKTLLFLGRIDLKRTYVPKTDGLKMGVKK